MNFFRLPTFDKHHKTQLLAKFKTILYMGFRATLNFRKSGHRCRPDSLSKTAYDVTVYQ